MRTIHKQLMHLRPGQERGIVDHRGNRIVITGPVKKLDPLTFLLALIIAALCGGLIVGILGGILSLLN